MQVSGNGESQLLHEILSNRKQENNIIKREESILLAPHPGEM